MSGSGVDPLRVQLATGGARHRPVRLRTVSGWREDLTERLACVDRRRARHVAIARAAAPGVVADPHWDGVLIAQRLLEVRLEVAGA